MSFKFITKEFRICKETEKQLPDKLLENILSIGKDYGIKTDNIEFYRKGYETYKQPEFIPGERAAITYITTGRIDRDGDVVRPDGGIFDDYLKHPVVMAFHDYKKLPVGKNIWVKKDNPLTGLIAKTVYANHKEADDLYNYRKDLFPLATSIGFVPVEYKRKGDPDFDAQLKDVIKNGWVKENDSGKAGAIITKWALIEYSDCAIPSNPDALQLAVSKGIITNEQEVEDNASNSRFIIQINGLKDINKEEIKVEEKKEVAVEIKTEVKTITPPIELIPKEIITIIEQKKADKKGNPSVNDIKDAIYVNMKKMREDMDKMHMEKGVTIKYDENNSSTSYMGMEDLYPVEYPNGHVVCCYCSDYSGPRHFYDYKYKYDVESKTCEMGKMMEMEVGYISKGICEREIKNLNKLQLLKSDLSKIETEQLKDIPLITLITSPNLIADNLNNICLFTVDSKLYKTELDYSYIKGAEYIGSKNLQVDKHFSKFISIEAKSMDEWVQIKYDLRDFYLKSAPGKEEMLKFCKDHNLQHKDYLEKVDSEDEIIEKGVDETENEIRIRVQDSSLFEQDSFKYKIIKSSKPRVKAVFGKKKGSSTMELQAYRFPKEDGWDKKSAKAWVKEHGKKSYEYTEGISTEEVTELVVGAIEKRNNDLSRLIEEALQKAMGKVQVV